MADAPKPEQPRGSFSEEALPHMDAVYRFALRLTGSRDAAEDLVQDTFFRAYRAWDQYTPGTQCKSWLFTICRNLFLRQRERTQRHDELVQVNAPRPSAADQTVNPLWKTSPGGDPERDFFGSLVDGEILAAIDGLPEEYRMAVVLSDLEGFSYQEVAEMMDVPVGTVKSRLFRGRRQLQELLYDYALSEGYIQER